MNKSSFLNESAAKARDARGGTRFRPMEVIDGCPEQGWRQCTSIQMRRFGGCVWMLESKDATKGQPFCHVHRAGRKDNELYSPYWASTRSIPLPRLNLLPPPTSRNSDIRRVSSLSTNSLRDISKGLAFREFPESTPGLRPVWREGEGGGGSSWEIVSWEDPWDDWLAVRPGVGGRSPASSFWLFEPGNKTRPIDVGADRRATGGLTGDGLVARYSINSAASASSVAFGSWEGGLGVVVRCGASSPRCLGEPRLNISAVRVAAALMSSFSVTLLRARPSITVRTVLPCAWLGNGDWACGVRRGLADPLVLRGVAGE